MRNGLMAPAFRNSQFRGETVGFMCHTWLDSNIQLFTQTLACVLLQRHFVNEIEVHNQLTLSKEGYPR